MNPATSGEMVRTDTGTPPATHSTPSLTLRWRKRWHRWRNRLLIDPNFQSQAMRLPFGRLIGHRRALGLHHITAGFVYSQVLAACVELDLFATLKEGDQTTLVLAEKCGMPVDGMRRLLLAAGGLDLVEHYPDDSWALGILGAAMLANPGVAGMVQHHQHLYRDLLEPVALLRSRQSTHLSRYWPYARGEHSEGGSVDYSDLMASSQKMIAEHVLRACPLPKGAHLVDIAGGSGTFAREALAATTDATATVVDLPDVAARAAASNAEPRLRFVGESMFTTEQAKSADVVSVVRILHDHDDEPVQTLLRQLHDTMPANSRLVIAEPLAETPGAESIGHTYFGIYLWAMGSGRPRTRAELTQFLAAAGFKNIEERPSAMPCLVRVLTAIPNKA